MSRLTGFAKLHFLFLLLSLLPHKTLSQSVKFATTTDFFISIKPCGRCCFERWDVGICRPFNTVPGPEGCTVNSCLCKDSNIKAAATSHLNSCVDVSCDGDVGAVQNAVSFFDGYCSRYLEGEGGVVVTTSSDGPGSMTVPARTTDGPVEETSTTTEETSTTTEETTTEETSTEETSTAEETSTTTEETSTTEELSTTEESSTTEDSSTTTPSPSPSPTTRFPITTTTYSPSPSPTPPSPPDEPGLSVSIKIGLGVGFGVGVPTIAVTIYLFCRFGLCGRFNIAGRIRRRRIKRRKEERPAEQIEGDFIEPIQGEYSD
ncbi:hypothetical protein TWF281_001511 [Arthrobotrys megalospora]